MHLPLAFSMYKGILLLRQGTHQYLLDLFRPDFEKITRARQQFLSLENVSSMKSQLYVF